MSDETFRWAAGGFLLLLCFLTKNAYSDPKFYTDFVEKIVDKVAWLVFLCTGSVWAGLAISHSYVEKKLGLSPSQLKLYNADYQDFTSYIAFAYYCAMVALGYNIFLNLLASHKKKSL
ncbi:hypothetical protein ACMSZN_000812 [Cronobacter dublinensis]